MTVTLVVRRRAVPLQQSTGARGVCEDSAMMPGFALQTCKRSVVHDGFELRQVTFHKLTTTDSLGLRLQRCALDQHTYYQVYSFTFLSVCCLMVIDRIAIAFVRLSPLPSNRQYLSCDACREVKRENNHNCSVLCCVRQLCTVIRTQM